MEKSIKKYFPVFALPTLVAFTIGFIIPFIMGIYLSFCEFTTVTDAKFVGLKNYIRIFSSTISAIFYARIQEFLFATSVHQRNPAYDLPTSMWTFPDYRISKCA